VDATRATLWVLLPLAVAGTLVLVGQGVPLNFAPFTKAAVMQAVEYDEPVTDAEGKPVLEEQGQPRTKKARLTEQVIAVGLVAIPEPIKNLGTNGGGFFNVNGAHPFENPSPLTNLLEMRGRTRKRPGHDVLAGIAVLLDDAVHEADLAQRLSKLLDLRSPLESSALILLADPDGDHGFALRHRHAFIAHQ